MTHLTNDRTHHPTSPPRRMGGRIAGATLVALLGAGCGSDEAPRVALPVTVDASQVTAAVVNDLGYSVTLSAARAALQDLHFTVGGETHLAWPARLGRLLVPVARAHPGHAGGGEVLGELPGALLVDWMSQGSPLGTATLVAGRYRGADFTFRRASPAELPAGDPLLGHTFFLEGTASKGGRALPFTALVDLEPNVRLIGAPYDHEVTAASRGTLGLRLLPADPTEPGDTLFDLVDFFALADAAGGAAVRDGRLQITPGQEAHNLLVRKLRSHDHYDVTHR